MELRIIPGTKTIEEHLAIFMANEIDRKISDLPHQVQKNIYKNVLKELEKDVREEE
ncbi:hypothetical protein SAMN05446037_1002111 [Anaerovirgula multivorans]|uniref:Uncharacterized protein n=1 Tax=Anaerovirgula multivorans TaxID=312168 RepID=A0A239AKS2_9FIRM|nr:hypothetical protein [Anaerovirgula multivorans]SNR96139.1 hypothetical protein SAMN05446037_1002111 [Anaerovirgula multivorans]